MGFPQVNGDQVKANTIINNIEDNLNSADKIEVSVKEASENMEPSLVERLKALAANEDFEDEHLGKPAVSVDDLGWSKEDSTKFKSMLKDLGEIMTDDEDEDADESVSQVSPQKNLKMAKVPEGVGVATEAEYQVSEINAEVPQTKITGEITQNQAAGENIGRNDPSYFKGVVYLDENPGAFAYIASAEINGKEMPIEKGCKTSDEFYDYLKKLGEVVKLGRVNTMFGEKLDTYRKSLHDYNSAEEGLIGDTSFRAGDHVKGKDSAGNIITGKVLHPGYWEGAVVIEVDNPRKIPRRSSRNMNISDDDFARKRKEAKYGQVANITDVELVEESATEALRKPKYYDTVFGANVRAAFDDGELTYDNIQEWDTLQNGGIPPKPAFNTKEILDYYRATGYKKDPREREHVHYYHFDKNATEDTVKQGNSWVNKGKEGTHGKFKTKKAADAQRKAMFANGYTANEEVIKGQFVLNDKQKNFILYNLFDDPDSYDVNSEWVISSDKTLDPVRNESDDKAFPYVLIIDGKFVDALTPEYVGSIMKADKTISGATEEMDEYELATSLNNLIRDEYEAIDGYNDMISDLEKNKQNEDIIPVLTDINNEENTHVGQLQEALKTISPAADHIAKGEVEAEGQLREGEAMEEYEEEMYGFEAMSTPDLESFQAVIADKLNKEGSITVLDILMDRDLSYDFTEQMNFIKNTMDLSNTNEILNEILKAAETLLDDIQIEELVEEFSSDTLEEGEEVDQEFEEYEEPEDWSKVDEEVVEEEPVEPEGEEPTV